MNLTSIVTQALKQAIVEVEKIDMHGNTEDGVIVIVTKPEAPKVENPCVNCGRELKDETIGNVHLTDEGVQCHDCNLDASNSDDNEDEE